jgi:hypothetical protein
MAAELNDAQMAIINVAVSLNSHMKKSDPLMRLAASFQEDFRAFANKCRASLDLPDPTTQRRPRISTGTP